MTTAKPLPPLEVLEEWFSYDLESGSLTWKKDPSFKQGFRGKEAGYPTEKGYRKVKLLGEVFYTHRLAFKLAIGVEPPEELDHRDGDRQNNRLQNLRVPEGRPDNAASRALMGNNTSGHTGVLWVKAGQCWMGRITRHGKRQCATFSAKDEAIAWRLQKEEELHGEFAQSRRNGSPELVLPDGPRLNRRNTSGVTGVNLQEKSGLWIARISIAGRRLHRCFQTKDEALKQRLAWEQQKKDKSFG